jgi:hypothetical protein
MASSSRRATLLVGIAAMIASLAACDSLLGLGNYNVVPADGGADSGGGATGDAADENDSTIGLPEAGPSDAGDASDVTADDAPSDAGPPPDVSVDAPSLVTLWAQWPMPNPDAATAPESGTLLPNQMTYDLGADGGSPTAYDTVTKLTWVRQPTTTVSSYAAAADYCANLMGGYQVPTRIQLVSLIDFTQNPTINAAAFPEVMGGVRYWTASVVHGPVGPPKYWTVDFGTGLTANTQSGGAALCVKEGP